ncbi:MAG TPA: hypothetical protein VNO30_07225 [Kofleriaceae bacterium]|nr:hypothetical protein [Kofleriaceae bacterium]
MSDLRSSQYTGESLDPAHLIERAERELGTLDYHVQRGYLLPREAMRLRGELAFQLGGHRKAAGALLVADPADHETADATRDRLELALRLLRGAIDDFYQLLAAGHSRRCELARRRARIAGADADLADTLLALTSSLASFYENLLETTPQRHAS